MAVGTAARERAERFARAHETLFLLPNAWDAGSARLLASRPDTVAIGTSSAAAAATDGLPDGERIDRDAALAAAAAMVDAAGDVPVTVDLEAGFGTTPEEVHATTTRAVVAGAAGVNIEDTDPATGELRDVGLQTEIVAAAAGAIRELGSVAVLNARTDVFWNPVGEPTQRVGHALDRLRRYREAGATCLFVPGAQRTGAELGSVERVLAELVGGCDDVPVNVLASRDLGLDLESLAGLGVRRISFGSSLYRAALACATAIVDDVSAGAGWDALAAADRLPYGQLAEIMTGPDR
ncbi:carboxyvinyl-carboxyphosphonate phosphorylmutase [Actinomycetospora sp. NBRC 106375]|uniref:isocitrate lyase/PEP mutase family protein n=1 Tax=Actinomycetospora sp. NBRC 106375 TaxID=3032207 RepID=UPI00249FF49C|nr:isocitrate lyase/phosphoenolpyruvate mutase family protein [Actinomycetospora sp. NBRC 106375]GLZ50215.1 carboxyvinyl-carboxyphosphonate phosphorylmutase [Actinomycetospora sp. NBRC 106375]